MSCTPRVRAAVKPGSAAVLGFRRTECQLLKIQHLNDDGARGVAPTPSRLDRYLKSGDFELRCGVCAEPLIVILQGRAVAMQRKSDSGSWTALIKGAIVDSPGEQALDHTRTNLTAYQIAQLRALAYRDCPSQTLPPLPSLQQPLPLERE
jgi:hypothetical protein